MELERDMETWIGGYILRHGDGECMGWRDVEVEV
jgi:hypothetical protein